MIQFDIRENEFAKNGLPYCKKCGKPHFVQFEDFISRCICECDIKERQEKLDKIEQERRQVIFRNKQKYSGLGEKYYDVTFLNANVDKFNKEVYTSAYNYCEHIKEMISNNIGLYFWGANGSGKTHLTACICNEIMTKTDYIVKFTSIAKLLQDIQATYSNDTGLTIASIINELKTVDLVVIDDLGKEFLGGKSAFAERMLYEIINARYNANKPIIFSSNFTIKQLLDELNVDRAIVERIGEMSNKIMKVEGHNFRRETYSNKADLLKEFNI